VWITKLYKHEQCRKCVGYKETNIFKLYTNIIQTTIEIETIKTITSHIF